LLERLFLYQGDLDPKRAGLIATSKILSILILAIPSYLFHSLGFPTIGDAGLMMTMMTACYSAFPSKPLEGRAIICYAFNCHWRIMSVPTNFLM